MPPLRGNVLGVLGHVLLIMSIGAVFGAIQLGWRGVLIGALVGLAMWFAAVAVAIFALHYQRWARGQGRS
jgi:tryptophan-rich sensory protein